MTVMDEQEAGDLGRDEENCKSVAQDLLRLRQTRAQLQRQVLEYRLAGQRLSVRDAVTSALAESSSLGEAAPKILRTVCETLGWELGALWTIEPNVDLLRCVEVWHAPTSSAPEFEAETQRRTFSRGVGMPGRVWATAQPAWIPDVTVDDNFPRSATAAKEGIRASLGFPIIVEKICVGVMEFFSREIRQPDQALLDLLRVLGSQIGQFVERKRAEANLRESEERFRRVFEEGPLGLALVGGDYRFVKVNSALCQMVGYSEGELVEKTFAEITHPDDVPAEVALAEQLFKGEIPFYRLQKRYVKRNGEIIWINLTASIIHGPDGEPVHGLAMVEDITEIKRTQDEALFRQKLESVGTLAGGIAHDFNNILGGVEAQAELALAELDAGSSCKDELNAIREVAMRGSEIVRELMIYAGKESGVVELVDLSKVVAEMLALLKVSVTKHAVIMANLDQDLPATLASAAQLRQVVMNLITNASDAIGDRDGVIRVITRRVTLKGESAAISSSMLPLGDYVELEVSDTGSGMSPQTQSKVFDPFFTTKSAGRGLGLAVVQGIVRSLGGAIHLTSEPEKGTRFQILLSCAEATAGESGHMISGVGEVVVPSQNVGILVVEDEGPLRQAVVKMLRKTGFKVFEAADGSSAIGLLRADGGKIDVMLLDMTIPGASSHEVVAEAAKAKPDIRVILTSA